jgi:hypothetical protein
MPEFPTAILERAAAITGRRARVVVEHILQHGSVTTEDLTALGYEHPPRAIKDVTDQGLPLVKTLTKGATGRRTARYTFGDLADIRADRVGGRTALPKSFRDQVSAAGGGRCAVCNAAYAPRYLQTDHRIPFAVAGESASREVTDYMPLCGSCNRAKSWSCEHCPNWAAKSPAVCATCYWAAPADYRHVATRDIRRLEAVWDGNEVSDYDRAAAHASADETPLPEFVKRALRRAIPPEA